MTKQDIVRAISEQLDLPKAKAQEAVQTTFDALINALVKEGRVELRNFGVFQIKRRDGRVARNPRTGDIVNVPPRYFVSFKPGKEMETRVRKIDESQAP
ncbi:MAG: HU family DNA-binding protein [Pirellulales bacterium]